MRPGPAPGRWLFLLVSASPDPTVPRSALQLPPPSLLPGRGEAGAWAPPGGWALQLLPSPSLSGRARRLPAAQREGRSRRRRRCGRLAGLFAVGVRGPGSLLVLRPRPARRLSRVCLGGGGGWKPPWAAGSLGRGWSRSEGRLRAGCPAGSEDSGRRRAAAARCSEGKRRGRPALSAASGAAAPLSRPESRPPPSPALTARPQVSGGRRRPARSARRELSAPQPPLLPAGAQRGWGGEQQPLRGHWGASRLRHQPCQARCTGRPAGPSAARGPQVCCRALGAQMCPVLQLGRHPGSCWAAQRPQTWVGLQGPSMPSGRGGRTSGPGMEEPLEGSLCSAPGEAWSPPLPRGASAAG